MIQTTRTALHEKAKNTSTQLIQKLFQWFHLIPNAFYNVTAVLILVAFFSFESISSLVRGGRWDLYEQIAMADRWPDTYGYSAGKEDSYLASTPYGPGLSLLAVPLRVFGTKQDTAMLLLAVGVILCLIFFLYLVYKRLNGAGKLVQFMGIFALVLLAAFDPYLAYAREFKPDTLAIVFVICGYLLLSDANQKWFYYVGIFFSVFAALLLKQQTVALIATLFLCTLILRHNSVQKWISLLALVGGALAAISAYFIIPGAANFAIFAHAGRQSVQILTNPDHQHLFILILIICLLGFSTGGLNQLKKMFCWNYTTDTYLAMTIVWIIVGLLGASNLGGNTGNTSSGLILLIPYVVSTLYKIWKPILIIGAISLIFFIKSSLDSGLIQSINYRLTVEGQIQEWVKQHNPSSALIAGDSYMAIRGIHEIKISEIDTWAHLQMGNRKEYAAENFGILINEVDPQIIICSEGCGAYESAYSIQFSEEGYVPVPLQVNPNINYLYRKLLPVERQ
jgi:voltage-gated potassium channel Kch